MAAFWNLRGLAISIWPPPPSFGFLTLACAILGSSYWSKRRLALSWVFNHFYLLELQTLTIGAFTLKWIIQKESNLHRGMFAYPIGQETLCLGRATITLCIKNAGNIGNRTHTLHLNQQTRLVYFKFALVFTTHWNCSTVKPTFTGQEFFTNMICFTGRVADAPYLECISINWLREPESNRPERLMRPLSGHYSIPRLKVLHQFLLHSLRAVYTNLSFINVLLKIGRRLQHNL